MLAIYEFFWDCGRSGNVEGLFIADKEDVEKAMGNSVYFGEILGKHSEIYGTLEEDDLKIKSEDQDFIQKCIEVFGNGTISGYNPLSYLDESEEDPEDEDIEEDEDEEGC